MLVLLLQMLQMLAGKDPAMLHMLGVNPGTLTAQLARHKKAAAWGATTAAGLWVAVQLAGWAAVDLNN